MPTTRTALCTLAERNNGVTKIMLTCGPEVIYLNLEMTQDDIDIQLGVEYEITIRRAGWKERRDG